MRYKKWLPGAILAAALFSASANAANCPIESGMFGYDQSVNVTPEHPLLIGSVFKEGDTTFVGLLAVGMRVYSAFAADCKIVDGKVREGWGSAREFGDKFVALHGATMTFDNFVKKVKSQQGFALPGFALPGFKATAATKAESQKSACTYCRARAM